VVAASPSLGVLVDHYAELVQRLAVIATGGDIVAALWAARLSADLPGLRLLAITHDGRTHDA